ncbi:hypothetical protein ACQ4PT_046800 [Festuca glaucescens]
MGVVAGDHSGVMTAAASIVIDSCWDAEEAEACAIREGIKLGLDLNLMPASIESDCANAVAAANSKMASASRSWGVYKGIQVLKDSSPDCDIISTSRRCNTVAHDLARLARTDGISKLWLPPFPVFISNLSVKCSGTNLMMNE